MPIYVKKKLSQVGRGVPVKIVALKHKDKKTLCRLHSMGVYEGATVVRKTNGSPSLIEVSGSDVALGAEFTDAIIAEVPQKTAFLLGNPNVGKSSLFSRLTGIKIYTSNYPGSTVDLSHGEGTFSGTPYTIYDMPGVYSMDEACESQNPACNILKAAPYDIAIYVADAQHLERNLFFAMDIISLGKPTVLLLNKYDIARKKGVEINARKLSSLLGIPVIKTNGLTGKGLRRLEIAVREIQNSAAITAPVLPASSEEKWRLIGKISKETMTLTHRHPSLIEKLEDATTAPITGLPIAIVIMILSFAFTRFAGEGLIGLLTPLYENYYLPFMQNLFSFTQDSFVWTLLFGAPAGSEAEGMGMLSEGVKIAFVDVFSYVISFYAVLEFLGDFGYLPRIAVAMDRFLHKIGLHGYSAIPIMLGFGCKVPAIMGARVLETKRQKIIAAALILMLAPCISQTAMMFSVLAPHGLGYLLAVFAVLACMGIAAGYLLNKIMPGDTTDIFMEIPDWQIPKPLHFLRKLFARVKEFIIDVAPLIVLGIAAISVMEVLGITELLGKIFRWPVSALMGLPEESALAISLGFLRKDVSIIFLTSFGLTAKQLVVACVFMAAYMPCMASFFVLLKELGIKDGLKICALTLFVSLFAAMFLNFAF